MWRPGSMWLRAVAIGSIEAKARAVWSYCRHPVARLRMYPLRAIRAACRASVGILSAGVGMLALGPRRVRTADGTLDNQGLSLGFVAANGRSSGAFPWFCSGRSKDNQGLSLGFRPLADNQGLSLGSVWMVK